MTRMGGSVRVRVATLLAAALIANAMLRAQSVPEIQSVLTMSDGGTIVVVIEANGPLPMPIPGFAENPPRRFFDFQGVSPTRKTIVNSPGFGVVRQTRTALYAPNVTRVVLDLVKLENYRIDADEREAGRMKIVLGPQVSTGESIPSPPVTPAIEHLLPPRAPKPMQPQPVQVESAPVFAAPPPAPVAAAPTPVAPT